MNLMILSLSRTESEMGKLGQLYNIVANDICGVVLYEN